MIVPTALSKKDVEYRRYRQIMTPSQGRIFWPGSCFSLSRVRTTRARQVKRKENARLKTAKEIYRRPLGLKIFSTMLMLSYFHRNTVPVMQNF